jgi:2-hydroxy-3-keto-5-methylthiopentenyl-1-phosphate phosphatase
MTQPRHPPTVSPIIFSDFDGTITRRDVTDEILTQFALPSWREIEKEWRAGRIGSRDCLAQQLALVRARPAELNSLIDSIPVDPKFAETWELARQASIPFVVVSDGLDFVIRRILTRTTSAKRLTNGRDFFSTGAQWRNGRLTIHFPHAVPGCTHGCATCKPLIIRRLAAGRRPILYIGDGLSDRYAVEESDLVFARQPLFEFCRERGIPCRLLRDFGDLKRNLTAGRKPGIAPEMTNPRPARGAPAAEDAELLSASGR